MLLDDRPATQGVDISLPRTWIPAAVLKHRHTFYVIVFGFFLAAFNGQWRVGRDSALYRGLGHSLASGHGYTFGEFGSRTIYPGLPVMLAGLEKVFGVAALPGILLIHLFALGVLIFTYFLVRLHFPKWIAITVTCWVGLNPMFLEFSNDIRDDVPFLCALMITLYGWERLRIALGMSVAKPHSAASLATREDAMDRSRADAREADRSRADERAPQAERLNEQPYVPRDSSVWKPLVIFITGLLLAATLRPTFWILAIACVLVCALGLLTGPRRRFYAIALASLVVVWLLVALVDPRVRGFSPFAGGYERDARIGVENAAQRVADNAYQLIDAELCYAFWGQKWLPGLTQLVTVALIASSLLLWRTNPLWTLLVLLTVVVTLLMRTVPRYYLMVLPLMALSWLLLLIAIGRQLGPRGFIVTMLIGILTLNAMNIAGLCNVVAEQRTGKMLIDGPKWGQTSEMARKIREVVPPGARVIAPNATIVHYLSGRAALMQRDILDPKKQEIHWPRHLAALGIGYAVFPGRLYDGGERRVRELMDKAVIVPTERIAVVPAPDEPMVLAKVEIQVPPVGKDWRKRPTTNTMDAKSTVAGTTRPSRQQLAVRQRRNAALRREAAERKALAQARTERDARAERLEKKQAAARKAAKARRARHAQQQKQPPPATAPATTPTSAVTPTSRRTATLSTPPPPTSPSATSLSATRTSPFPAPSTRPPINTFAGRVSYFVDLDRRTVMVGFDGVGLEAAFASDVGGRSGQVVASRSASIC